MIKESVKRLIAVSVLYTYCIIVLFQSLVMKMPMDEGFKAMTLIIIGFYFRKIYDNLNEKNNNKEVRYDKKI